MKELEDYSWFPNFLRVQQLEYIGWLVITLDLYKPLVPLLNQWLLRHNFSVITDLCSGSGQPVFQLASRLNIDEVTTTDLYPQGQAIQLDIQYLEDYKLEGLVTMFNAFHHFDTQGQSSVLRSIANQQNPSLIVEILQPTLIQYLHILAGTTVGQILTVPFVQPFRWTRILLTYLLPINLLTVAYDGLVSVYKSKTVTQYQELAYACSTDEYQWSAQTIKSNYWTQLTLLKGQPIC